MLPDFQLITPRLTLRPVTPADRADLVALEADPEVMAMMDRENGDFLGWIAFFDDGGQPRVTPGDGKGRDAPC